MVRAAVLYEDSAAGQPIAFGPHRLALQCLADRLQQPAWDLDRALHGQPKKGNAQLRRACRDARLYDASRVVIAVYDDDQVRRMLGLSTGACKSEVREKLRAESPVAERLHVVLLQRNMEALVRAACECSGLTPPAGRKPSPTERDRILAAVTDPSQRHDRECLLEQVPSFAYLVDKLAAAVA